MRVSLSQFWPRLRRPLALALIAIGNSHESVSRLGEADQTDSIPASRSSSPFRLDVSLWRLAACGLEYRRRGTQNPASHTGAARE